MLNNLQNLDTQRLNRKSYDKKIIKESEAVYIFLLSPFLKFNF